MNKEVKTKWLEALRGGEYKQTFGVLENTEDGESSFCCLGVLANLAAKEGVCVRTPTDNGYAGYSTHGASLPLDVCRWAELETEFGSLPAPVYTQGGPIWELAALNDTAGYTFEQIAQVIEEQL